MDSIPVHTIVAIALGIAGTIFLLGLELKNGEVLSAPVPVIGILLVAAGIGFLIWLKSNMGVLLTEHAAFLAGVGAIVSGLLIWALGRIERAIREKK